MYKAIQSSRLYEQIVNQIEEFLLSGRLKPGDQLPPERELAEQFQVSRTAVREAIKTLREKGLVEAYPGRGTFITSLRSGATRQSLNWIAKFVQQPDGSSYIAEVRDILEPEIAARAATRATAKHVEALREAVAAMDEALDNATVFIEADLDFHLVLAEAVDNPIILSLIDSAVSLLREQRTSIFSAPGGPEHGQAHHKRILAAIERRDPAAAREAMQAHLEQVRRDSAAGAAFQASSPAAETPEE